MTARLSGVFTCVCVLGLMLVAGSPLRAADDDPITIKPRANLDEELFAVRVLEEVYVQWPRAEHEPLALQVWLQGTRLRMTRIHKSLKADEADNNIIELYADVLKLLDEYEDFLVLVGRIRRDIDNRNIDPGMIGLDAAARGFGVLEFASRIGLTGPQAIVVGGVVAVGSGLFDWYSRKQSKAQLDAADQQFIIDQARKINNRFEAAYAGAQTVVRKLSPRKDWGTKGGFDDSVQKSPNDQLKLRPRDPFIILYVARVLSSDREFLDKQKPEEIHELIALCLEAARWVPAGFVYDPFRAELVAVAAKLANEAAVRELIQASGRGVPDYSVGPAESAKRAISLHRTYLKLEPKDPARIGQRELARSLAMDGRYREAIDAANIAMDDWKTDAGFAYRYARLSALTGNLDQAEAWLKWSYAKGQPGSRDIANDPDLAKLRAQRPDAFKKLTTVTARFEIDTFAFTDDDIIIYNDSPFPLTNVTMDVEIKKGNNVIRKSLTVGYVAPGGSYRWKDAVRIPDSTYDSASATVKCDQNK